MIEVVYTSKDNEKSNDIIRLPKNIKQIGDIKDSRKIYIEDYAINYIEEIHLYGMDRAVGVLLGKSQKSGSDRYIFIKGAILIPNAFITETQIEITEHDWAEIYNNLGKYFPNQEIVGWFASLESVNAAMLRTLKKVHVDQFAGGEKVLLIHDRQEKKQYFCVYDNNQLVRQNGYTIYYERNEEMQDYMVDMRSGQDKMEEYQEKIASRTLTGEVERGGADVVREVPASKRQSFVNYCANVAMVVLVLFIGMYMLDSKKDQQNQEENISSTVTPVLKVDGEVYPTTESTIEFESESAAMVVQDATRDINAEETMLQAKETTAVVKETTPLVQETTAVTRETTALIRETTAATRETTAATRETTPAETKATESATSAGTVITVNTDGQRKKEPVASAYTEHVVKKGENLITICKKQYGNTDRIDEVMKINDIDDVDKIYIGQIIKLP